MAADEALVARLRERLTDADVTEKRMFGGVAYLTHGNMTVGVIGDDLIVRVGSAATEDALARPGTRPFDLTGRAMSGWVMVDGAVLDDADLDAWIARGADYVATLPPKESKESKESRAPRALKATKARKGAAEGPEPPEPEVAGS